jgi:hypothetical protein
MLKELGPRLREDLVPAECCGPDFIGQPLHPSFSDLAVEFCDELSGRIFARPGIREHAEMMALAFWLREANARSIIRKFRATIGENEHVAPRGVAFHIAPSNVDSIAMYSWILSLLSSNINIIRLSHHVSAQMEMLCTILRDMLHGERWRDISMRTLIITYPRDDEITEFFSRHADVRVIWGGDHTIRSIRSLPTRPCTKDIVFADKVSYAVINSSEYLALDDGEARKLAHDFYNDAYLFDQMACSSPRMVYFAGKEADSERAAALFWDRLNEELSDHGYADSISTAMDKLVLTYQAAAKAESKILAGPYRHKEPHVIGIPFEDIHRFRETCGGGVFYQCFIRGLDQIAAIAQGNDQTLTYFGFSREDLRNLLGLLNGKGIDRIVPVGQALNFSEIWDGYVLLNELTKRIAIA